MGLAAPQGGLLRVPVVFSGGGAISGDGLGGLIAAEIWGVLGVELS